MSKFQEAETIGSDNHSETTFEFHEAQKTIVNNKKRFRVAVCGRRFGKTQLAVWEMYGFALYHDETKVIYVAPTIKQARDIVWEELKKITEPAWYKEPNETRLEIYIQTENGKRSEIWLRGAENIESIRGIRIDFLVVDEVASMEDWTNTWKKVISPATIDRKAPCLFIGTPSGLNHFYDMYMLGQTNENWASFRYTTYDNPHIPVEEIDRAKAEAEATNTMDEFRQEYMAEFVTVAGQVYKEWDPITQFKDFDYDPSIPLYVGMDFGVNDPTAIIWMQRLGGEYRVIDYYEASDANVAHFIQVIRSKPYKAPELYCGDPAGKARSLVTGTSVIEEYQRSGIFIRTIDGVKIPDQVRTTHKYMKSLFVKDTLSNFRDHILNYRYPNKKVDGGTNEIPLHDKHSHAMRALEYMFTNLDGLVPSSFTNRAPVFTPVDDVIGV